METLPLIREEPSSGLVERSPDDIVLHLHDRDVVVKRSQLSARTKTTFSQSEYDLRDFEKKAAALVAQYMQNGFEDERKEKSDSFPSEYLGLSWKEQTFEVISHVAFLASLFGLTEIANDILRSLTLTIASPSVDATDKMEAAQTAMLIPCFNHEQILTPLAKSLLSINPIAMHDEVLLSLLTRCDLTCENEMDIVRYVYNWIDLNRPCEATVSTMLRNLRINMLTADDKHMITAMIDVVGKHYYPHLWTSWIASSSNARKCWKTEHVMSDDWPRCSSNKSNPTTPGFSSILSQPIGRSLPSNTPSPYTPALPNGPYPSLLSGLDTLSTPPSFPQSALGNANLASRRALFPTTIDPALFPPEQAPLHDQLQHPDMTGGNGFPEDAVDDPSSSRQNRRFGFRRALRVLYNRVRHQIRHRNQ